MTGQVTAEGVDLICSFFQLFVDKGDEGTVGKPINGLFAPLDCDQVGCVVECHCYLAACAGETDEASFRASALIQVVDCIDKGERDTS